jgi:hypothetical protein
MFRNKIPLIFFILACLVFQKAPAQPTFVSATDKIPGHPRILMLKGEEAGIRKTITADATWKKMHQAILTEADVMLALAPVERVLEGRRLLDKSREALRRVFFLSYAYRLSNEEKYLQRAEKELLAVAAFSDWNPSHFLDVAEMTMAVAIGYDWLFSNLSPASLQIIKEAILKKGLEPSLDAKYNSWLKASHNWNQVCNAGMTYGALAIYEDQPELAQKIINRALETIGLAMEDYGPGGAYPEGYSYWGYGTGFNVLFISALEKVYGKDFGLAAKPGFMQTAGYMQNMTGPSGHAFNYADAGSGGHLQPAMFWFANQVKNPALLWVERSRMLTEDPKKFTRERILPAVMLWNGGMQINNLPTPKKLVWAGQGKNPVALMRTSWTDPNAIFVGIKGGSPTVNHAHMDVGSFVMEANGVRWAMDFGMQSYNTLESKGIDLWGKGQNSQRWEIFRYHNRTHNTLTVDDALQNVKGYARIAGISENPAFLSATTDISELYQGLLTKANRGISIVNKEYVVVRDEVTTNAQERTIRWTMLTPATVKITGKNTAELTKDGKKLTLRVQEPATIILKTWSTDPPKDYDAPNPGTILVGFETKIPANSSSALTVLLIPETAANKHKIPVLPLHKWPSSGFVTK